MERNIRYIISMFVCCLAVCSCMTEKMEAPAERYKLTLTTKVSGMHGSETKATLYNNESEIREKALTLYGWKGSEYWIKGVDATYSSDKWALSESYNLVKTSEYSFLSYANLPSGGAEIATPETNDGVMTYTVSDISAAQSDVLLGRKAAFTPESGDVQIDYSHPYASVEFFLGNAEEVKSVTAISLTGVYTSGKTTFGQSSDVDANGVVEYEWTDLGKANATLEETGLAKTEGGAPIASFLVIPQNLASANAVVTVTYKDQSSNDGSFVKMLSEGSWKAGYTTTYTLFKTGAVEVSITDVKKPTNSGATRIYVRATITGAWYIDDKVVAPWDTSDGTFTGLPGTDWEESDGIYYYSKALANGESATALYTGYTAPAAPVAGAALKFDVLVQAIPYDASKTCREAFEALSEN